ncbi:MAG: SAP domain-containing protein, partial [Candidatus Poseidoniaceae archaeon]
ELVDLAKAQNLAISGTKADLVDRLLQAAPAEAAPMQMANAEEIEQIIEGLRGAMLAQRTPERVAHRRADLVRRRKVLETSEPVVEIMEEGHTEVEFTLRCESGTYVKETVHGDGGRTQPSVAALIRARCDVLWLDVADIHAD